MECPVSKSKAPPRTSLACARRQQGMSIIEVMVGLFVLGIGLLGMASLQNNAVRMNNTSYLYSQATLLASDITERMRANRYALASYAAAFNDSVSASTNCATSNCTDTQIAKWDVVRWRADLASSLPQGEGEIDVNGNDVTVLVRFYHDGADDVEDDAQAQDGYELMQIQVSTRI